MSLLENYVEQFSLILDNQQNSAAELFFNTASAVPTGVGAGLIFPSQAKVELGSPETKSAYFLLYSNASARNGIYLIGPDLSGLSGHISSFACIVILYGSNLSAEDYYRCLARFQRYADFPGWQVRIAGEKIWIRAAVSSASSPSFERAASTLSVRIRNDFPAVEAVRIWFITQNDNLVSSLAQLARDGSQIVHGIKESVWKERGFDYRSCQLAGHCGGCADKKTCASVRSMEARVKIRRRKETIKENRI